MDVQQTSHQSTEYDFLVDVLKIDYVISKEEITHLNLQAIKDILAQFSSYFSIIAI